jgi:hypothetical protein
MSKVAANFAEFDVLLTGFYSGIGGVRTVTLTEDEGFDMSMLDPKDKTDVMALLDLIFKYGQNDFQPRDCRSVSVGDIILVKLNKKDCPLRFYKVQSSGFLLLRRSR